MASQITITALLKTRLRLPLRIEEAHHVGEQRRLGIHPLGIGLQIQPTDSEGPDAIGRFRIQLLSQFDPRGLGSHGPQQSRRRTSQGIGQHRRHIFGRADKVGGISRHVEVAGMGPEPEPLFIHRDQTAGAIDDRTALPQGLGALGLQLTGTLLQVGGLHQLQPGHATHQPQQACRQDPEDDPEPLGGNLGQGNDPRAGAARTDGSTPRRPRHQYPALMG